MGFYKKFLDVFVKVAAILLMCLVGAIVLLMLNELVMRNFFNKSFRGMTELAGFMFLWMAFLGITVLFDRNNMIALDMLFLRTRGKMRLAFWYIQQIIAFGLGVVMVIAFVNIYPFVITEFYSSMPKFSKMWQFLPLAVSGVYLALKALYNIIDKAIHKTQEIAK